MKVKVEYEFDKDATNNYWAKTKFDDRLFYGQSPVSFEHAKRELLDKIKAHLDPIPIPLPEEVEI